MLSLKDKLSQVNKSVPPKTAGRAASLPGFTEVQNKFGACLYREIPLEQQVDLPGDNFVWPLLANDDRLNGFDPEHAVYLDLETNGLYLGAGAFAFLIGLGLVREGRPRLVQLFLRDPRDERAALTEAASLLAGAGLVTYNGKCFDWPLLADRYRFHRLSVPAVGPHLDMLHPARRFYRQELTRCGLKEVEHHVLGVMREGDIDGALIPAAYNRYLREGDTSEISTIVDHNALDISSLFNLTLYCGRLYQSNCTCQREGELMAVARSFLQAGAWEQAIVYLNEIASRDGIYQAEAWCLAGIIYKRRQDWPQALQCWEQAVVTSKAAITPLIEMAKYYEHVEHDYVQAHALTYQALQNSRFDLKKKGIKELNYRLQRLQNKLEAAAKEGDDWKTICYQNYR
ncbi:MAG: ribonuclease H-like domain-containing protein [Methylocystaceae bacterium]